jgi:hypothetical protein
VRCVKRLGVCVEAVSFDMLGTRITRADISPVIRWDSSQITADGESSPCTKDTYVLNRFDQTVLLMSSPGPAAATSGCTNWGANPTRSSIN